MILCAFILAALLARRAGPFPAYPGPALARHLAESYVDDRSWRYDILRRQHIARDIATVRLDPDARFVIERAYRALYRREPARPADPQSVWPVVLGRPPVPVGVAA
jgi:hypothetical protein